MKMVKVEIPEHIIRSVCQVVGNIKGERFVTHDFAVQYILEQWLDAAIIAKQAETKKASQ